MRKRALELAPEDAASPNDLAWNLALLGRELDRALELAEAAIAMTDSAPAVLDTLAAVRLRRGEPALALPVVERALPEARGETRSQLLFRRAEALAMLGRVDAARVALSEAAEAVAPERDAWSERIERVESLLN